MRLWVDGRLVKFDAPTIYDDLGNTQPDASRLVPVGVATVGAKCGMSHLAIFRDLYYIADELSMAESRPLAFDDPRFPSGTAGDEAMLRNRGERRSISR